MSSAARRCTSLLINPRLQANRGLANLSTEIKILYLLALRLSGQGMKMLLLPLTSFYYRRCCFRHDSFRQQDTRWVKKKTFILLGKFAETGMLKNRPRRNQVARSSPVRFGGGTMNNDVQRSDPNLEVERTLERGSALRQQPCVSLQEPAGK